MEVLFYLGIIVVGIVVVFINGSLAERKRYKRFLRSLDEDYGKKPEQEYEPGDMIRIARYHKSIPVKEGTIDDITWNDLDMDSVYQRMNVTQTSAGEEYLYHLLRTPSFERDELAKRDALIEFVDKEPDKRKNLQKILHGIGKVKRISLTDYLLLLSDLERESNLPHYALDVVIVASFAYIFVEPGWGFLIFMVALAYSIIWYYKRKGSISPYITTFTHILKMFQASEKINKLNYEELSEYTTQLNAVRSTFKNFSRNTYIIATGHRMSENPLDLFLDYVRMIFHLDITKFNSMLKQLQEHYDQIYILRDVIGSLDAAVSIASYRASLAYWCKPQFVSDEPNQVQLKATDIVHPLIDNPVPNSLEEGRGLLVTGSNASGKSTFLKTVAINAVLAQTINTVLAKEYRANMFHIYSSMALRDDLRSKESYYIVEIKSLKRILDAGKTQKPILCFVDEVLRGTNTVERIAASSMIMHSLALSHIMCIAATHDIELTHMLEEVYSNYHFQEEIEENDIRFIYQLYQGRAKTRNAIKLLGIIGYDESIINEAERIAKKFTETGEWSRVT